jgi:hypothetical protein
MKLVYDIQEKHFLTVRKLAWLGMSKAPPMQEMKLWREETRYKNMYKILQGINKR